MMDPKDVTHKSYNIRRMAEYQAIPMNDRWDMVVEVLDALISKLIENGTISIDDIRPVDLEMIAKFKQIKEMNPKS